MWRRWIVQSAQLQLTTAPGRVDTVAQQVFSVVGDEKGIVQSSHVTATGNPDGYANLQLSIPSAVLGQTLTALSDLHGASVVSRSDNTTDITGRVGGAGQRLAVGGSFTIGRAAHDAGRILMVVAGAALIGLAVLVPVGLVAALAGWAGLALRRRRREQALDLV